MQLINVNVTYENKCSYIKFYSENTSIIQNYLNIETMIMHRLYK